VYIWALPDWPALTWDEAALEGLVGQVLRTQSKLLGRMEALGFDLRNEAQLRSLTQEVVKSSEIEGEHLDSDQVRSSIARRLHIDVAGLVASDAKVDGVVEMMLDATINYDKPLTARRLHAWHAALLCARRNSPQGIAIGKWRDDSLGPMQVVSGPMGRERVHFEAPLASRVEAEIARFLEWFNASDRTQWLIKAGIAHLWFVTIHPFDDGNGRMARAIADMALARSDQAPQRFYSMSKQIREERKGYYQMLERTQRGGTDVTDWQTWFLSCLGRALQDSEQSLALTLAKARFWERFASVALNKRQIKMLNLMLDGFDGKMTSSKWARIAKCSQDTAYRDILALIDQGAIEKAAGGGRSTSYLLAHE